MAEKAKILVVEDEPSLRQLVRKVLERSGFEVLEAASGMAALELWDRDKPQLDLLLTDMVMPDGMSGAIGRAAQGRQPGAEGPLHFGLQHGFAGQGPELAGGDEFSAKALSARQLVETVRNALGLV